MGDHKLISHGKGEALWGECSCNQWAWLGTYEMPKGRYPKLRAAFVQHATYAIAAAAGSPETETGEQ